MKTKLSTFSNPNYNHGAGPIKRLLWIIIETMTLKNPIFIFSSLKIAILKAFGAKIGTDVVIKPSISIKHPWMLEIANDVWIGEKVWIDNLVPVKIENDVCISQGAMLLTGNHNFKKSTFDLITGEIVLEQGSWVGAKSVVCPGVTLKSHSILTVGSMATKDLDAYGIYQGNPAVFKKKREIIS